MQKNLLPQLGRRQHQRQRHVLGRRSRGQPRARLRRRPQIRALSGSGKKLLENDGNLKHFCLGNQTKFTRSPRSKQINQIVKIFEDKLHNIKERSSMLISRLGEYEEICGIHRTI